MSSSNKEQNSKLENTETRMSSPGSPYTGECQEDYNENERVELPMFIRAFDETRVGSENGEINDSEMCATSSNSILRHRRKSNPPNNGVIDEAEKEEKPNRAPPTYLQTYSNEFKDNNASSNLLEQSTRPLLSDKERIIAIVKPNNSESISNTVVIQKDDFVASGRPPNIRSKNVSSNDSDRVLGEPSTVHDSSLGGGKHKEIQEEPEIVSVDFDAILPYVGEMGRYQLGLYLLMCIPATLPAAFLAFNQVFLSATPTHWCKEPHLQSYNDVCFK